MEYVQIRTQMIKTKNHQTLEQFYIKYHYFMVLYVFTFQRLCVSRQNIENHECWCIGNIPESSYECFEEVSVSSSFLVAPTDCQQLHQHLDRSSLVAVFAYEVMSYCNNG